jgi:uncharacterized protein YbaP (TraB family)
MMQAGRTNVADMDLRSLKPDLAGLLVSLALFAGLWPAAAALGGTAAPVLAADPIAAPEQNPSSGQTAHGEPPPNAEPNLDIDPATKGDATEAPDAPPNELIEEVIVSGEQPGPSLWKVSKGDHVMWVLGTVSPLPRKMTWRSREVESVIAQAQQIIELESVNPNIGFFRGMRLLPAALRARRNPGDAQLKDILPPELYARWARLKATYIGDDKGLETWRPMLAGFRLYSRALEKSGLARSNVIWPVIRKLAKKHRVRITEPEIKFDVDDPRGLIKDFTETPLEADIACLAATVDRLETDLEPMKQRAAAWAVGDLETLQRLRSSVQETTCLDAFTSVPRLQEEYEKITALAVDKWMSTVEQALDRNTVTLAVLPMNELLRPTGRLAQLQAKGYTVERP